MASEQAHLAFYTLYFAGWQARIDRRPVAIEPLPSSGLISLHVPQGEHVVTLRFGRSGVRRAADLVSLAALLVVGALLWPAARAFGQIAGGRACWSFSLGLWLVGALGAAGWAFSSFQRAASSERPEHGL